LLSLCLAVYRLFEQLMSDFAGYSGRIREQFEASRCVNLALPELGLYRDFADRRHGLGEQP
jgi:hypothetical protein